MEVDLIDWAEVENYFDLPDDDEDEDDSTPLMDLILPLREDGYEDFLLNLQIFSLSAASFKGSWDRLIDAFNLHGVKELRLLNFKRAVELLDYIARTNVYLYATKAELVLCQAEMDNMEFEETEGGGFAGILCETKLESAGVCGEPSRLQKSFQGIAYKVDSLKLLHLRFTGKAERKPKFSKESENYGGNSPSPEFNRAYFEAERNGTTPPRRSPAPSEAEFRIRWEQIQGENWRDDEGEELEAFADWAFGPNGFLRLQVLVSGDLLMGTVSSTLIRFSVGTAAAQGKKRRSARSNKAILQKTS
ncbi:MAG: hypothetical protein Q9164_004924 [Protoblastenia rupestris]